MIPRGNDDASQRLPALNRGPIEWFIFFNGLGALSEFLLSRPLSHRTQTVDRHNSPRLVLHSLRVVKASAKRDEKQKMTQKPILGIENGFKRKKKQKHRIESRPSDMMHEGYPTQPLCLRSKSTPLPCRSATLRLFLINISTPYGARTRHYLTHDRVRSP